MITLTKSESNELAECIDLVRRGWDQAAGALTRIRDKKLYRATHKTFEDFCNDEFKMNRGHANRLISAAETISNLDPVGSKPNSERVVRPLTRLPPETQREAWKEAVETAPDGRVTAKHVENVVKEKFTEKASVARKEAEKDSEKLWTLKAAWKRAGKKDRTAFLKWIKQ